MMLPTRSGATSVRRAAAVTDVFGMPKHIRIALRLLGERTVSRVTVASDTGAATPISIASQKARALLYFVAMQKEHCATRGQLATLLWGDRTDALARQNLRQTLVSLRESLGVILPELLIVQGDIIQLRKDRLAVDAVAFASLARSFASLAGSDRFFVRRSAGERQGRIRQFVSTAR
jgi:DNA-binding SARP family transcriptional activator